METIHGWVYSLKDLKKVKFIILRNRNGLTQIVLNDKVSKELHELFATLGNEDVLEVHGTLQTSAIAKAGKEFLPSKIVVLNKCQQPLPLDTAERTPALLDTRLDNRFLDVRREKIRDVFLKKAEILHRAREFFVANKFIEINTSKIVAAGAEGGATLFPIKYYDKEAFLAQSPQLYKQMLVSALERVWEIAPAYRAEKSDTTRHVSEFLSVDMEMAFISSEEDVMVVQENLIKAMIPEVKVPFPRVTFAEANKLLGRNSQEDLDSEEEKRLGELMTKRGSDFYFITKYPADVKPFYIMADRQTSRGFDLEYKGLEISSGGQREHRVDVLTDRLQAKGLDVNNFEFYLRAFRHGMPPHGGFGFGVERLLEKWLGLGNVRETILFPRDRNRLTP